MKELARRVAVITGAASGIGRALAERSVLVGAGGAAWEGTWSDLEWVIGVNLWGVIHGVKMFTPLMLAQNTECHIVNTSSAAGFNAGGGSAPYAVTKHAVVALSESLYFSLE